MAPDLTRHTQVSEATQSTERLMRPQPFPVNIYEADKALVVVAPLPAVQPADVTIELWASRLRITANLRSAAPREYLVHEWNYGGYERELDLPPGYGGSLEARLANGQLAVRILKGETTDKVVAKPSG